jgi:hypothetical protein
MNLMRSRIIILIGLAVLTLARSYAQVDPNQSVREHKMARYNNMKHGGVAMIVVGSILVFVGGAIETKRFQESMNIWSTEPPKEDNNVGTVLFCSGMVVAGGGIPLAIIGARKYKYYKNNPDALSLGISTHPESAGLRLTYRF